MRRSSLGLALAIAPQRALAEVCDKIVGDRWAAEDGPVGVFVDAASTTPWLVVIAFVLALSLFSRVIAWSAAIVAGLLALAFAADWWEDHAIIQAAYQEGCTSKASLTLQIAVLAALALLFAIMPRLRSRIVRTV